MHFADWLVMFLVLSGIIGFGVYKSRTSRNLDGYFLSNRSLPWPLVLMSIMGTQASAITYLSGPGQAYSDGLRFVQYYFGLPLAMLVIAYYFVPAFHRLKVYTAYEFLEQRFDVNTRTFASFLFLLSRGLSTGVSIYAPSIILCSIMGWNIYITNVVMGGLLIVYTMSGGAKAVAYTQGLQMIIIFSSLFVVGYIAITALPHQIKLSDVWQVAKDNNKLNLITTGMSNSKFNWNDKYNLWSGIIGGFFLALSYFGTDHSQVGRYLTAKNPSESKKSLLMNGLVKIPMQILILFLGVLIFTFYYHTKAPVYFNVTQQRAALQTEYAASLNALEKEYTVALHLHDQATAEKLRTDYKNQIKLALPGEDVNDNNYIFLWFVKQNLPVGLIGLLFAVIFLAAWGSIAAALNSLAACTMVDFHKRFFNKKQMPEQEFITSKWYTFGWGIFCITIAFFANNIGNSLIEGVNILGSLFYGVMLGIFLVAFWVKFVKAKAVFWAAIITEVAVIIIYQYDIVSFLWLNVIGAIGMLMVSFILQCLFQFFKK